MNERDKKIIELQFAHQQREEAKARLRARRMGYFALRLGLGCGFLIQFFRWILYAPYLRAACVVGWAFSVIVYLELYSIPHEKSFVTALERLKDQNRIKLGILLLCMPGIGLIFHLLLHHVIVQMIT